MSDALRAPATPWLSILVPVYNVQDYLEECLASVVEQLQQLPDGGAGVEVLVLDDCSTDGSRALMDRLAQRWPGRLTLMHHAVNQGQSAARNTMIDAARGEYLWFLDSDDKLLPGALAQLFAIVQQHVPDVVLCDFRVLRKNSSFKHRLRGEMHQRTFDGPAGLLLHDCCALLQGLLVVGRLHPWSKISRRALWGNDLRFPVGRCFEDMAAVPLMALRARSFFYQAQPWVAYRQHAASVLATMNLIKVQDQVAALRPLREALRGTPCESSASLRLEMTHQCARSLVGAMRFLQSAGLPAAQRRVLVQRMCADFDAASPLSARQWVSTCLKRGWWLRAIKFLRAYRAPFL